ncbi:MAG: class I SAM-dependent methyltransferase [bacterium]
MLETFKCPVCAGLSWKKLQTFSYCKEDTHRSALSSLDRIWRKLAITGRLLFLARPNASVIHCRPLNAYQRLRRDVLFEVWFPDEHQVTLTAIVCSTCGFVTFSPRPTDEEIAAKYNYLKKMETDRQDLAQYTAYAAHLDAARAARIFSLIREHSGGKSMTILDYGGEDGKLLRPFVDRGHECFLADYHDQPIAGVTKIGDDIRNMKTDKQFDVILCSHVLEHVSDLSGLLGSLRAWLKPDGIIYAEAPQEIWAGLRIEADPVTHINFFTRNSFCSLFLLNGFGILKSKQEISNYGKTHMEVIWVLARPQNDHPATILPADVESVLYPSRIHTISKLFNMILRPKFKEVAYRCRKGRS